VNTISIPTAYFYNERLHEDNQLDYETKYAFLYKNKNASAETDQDSWFMTEAKFDRTIQNIGRKTLDAVLVDKTKDDASDYQPLVQTGFLNDFYRDTAHDVRRYIYFDKKEFKNNRIPTTMEVQTNSPKNRISKFGSVKFADNAGIAHIKYREEDELYIRSGIYNSSIKTVKSPYNATHDAGNVIEILTMDDEYDVKALLSVNSMLEIDGYHYIVNSIDTKNSTAGTQAITTKARKLTTANTFTSTNTVHSFTNKEVRYAPFTLSTSGKHRLNTEFASDTKIKVNESDRITLDGRTIAKENTTIYNSKLSTANNTSFYIDLEKGDAVHKYIEFANNATNYYQSDYPFMYYLSGGYTIHETVFTGFVEDAESKNEGGLLTFSLTGRDEIGDLLSTTITRNLNFTNDIVYSTSNPTVESGLTNFTTGTIASSGNITAGDTSFTTTTNLSASAGDLVYSQSSSQLIGEVLSVDTAGTEITLVMPALKATSNSQVLIYKNTKHISGLKALSSNTLETTRTTDFSSISGKGLVYSTGKDTTGESLVSTSDTGLYSVDGTLGYHISRTDSINGDSIHLLSVGTDDGFESVVQVNRTFNTESLSVVDIENIDDNINKVLLAPSLPVVLGRLDNGKFYHVNTNIPLGGYLHKLVNNSPNSPKSEDFYRYYNANRFNPGALNYTHSSIYADASSRPQKISGYSDLIHFSDDVSGITGSYTTSSNSSSPLTANITAGSSHVPKEIFYESALREEPLSALTQIDRRTIPYELYGLGDILPFSYKRANSLGRSAQGMTNFGLMFEDDKVGTGTEITHTNYTEKTKYRTKSDRNYDFSTISSASIDTNAMRRWGVMRLVEATFDWHFNPVDAESIPKTSDIAKVKYPIYYRHTAPTGSYNVTANGSDITLSTQTSFDSGDAVYLSDGRLVAVTNAALTNVTSLTSSNTSYIDSSKITSSVAAKTVKINASKIVHDDGEGLNGNDDANEGTYVYIDNLTETDDLQTLIDVHLLSPIINRDYLIYTEHHNLTKPPNVVLPLWAQFDTTVSTVDAGITSDTSFNTSDNYPSLYPINRMNTSFIHTSKVIHAILHTKPNRASNAEDSRYVSHALTHFDIEGDKHLYENCRLQFTDFKSSLQRTDNVRKPTLTSSDVLLTDISPTHVNSFGVTVSASGADINDIFSFYPSQTLMTLGYVWKDESSNSNLLSLTSGNNAEPSDGVSLVQGQSFVAPATTTSDYVNEAKSELRDMTNQNSIEPDDSKGQAYRAQMFVKPILTMSGSGSSVQKNMNSSTDAIWLEFVPNLTGYYVVRDFEGTTSQIAKITNHTRSVSNNIATHTLTFDNTIMAADYRIMRVAETTFEDTPDKIEFNKLFDTGLQYDRIAEDLRHSERRDQKTKYQEGIHSMFLFVDIDNLNNDNTNPQKHIDRRDITQLDNVFTDGEQIQAYVTDGNNKSQKALTINTTGNDFSISYDGKLTGNGVVSFGEIFEVVIPKKLSINPVNAYLGTTISVGSEVDTEIADVLKEIGLDVDAEQSLREYTGAIVDNPHTSSTGASGYITYSGTTDIAVDDVLYTHEGFLLGKVSAITSATDSPASRITFDSKEFVPAQYDEIIRRSTKTFVSLANFNDVDAFSLINYLATKKGLDYTIENKKMTTKRIDDNYGLRTYQLDYLTNNNITRVESNKSLFDKANKVIVIGDGVRAEAQVPTKKRTREVVVVEPNVKSLNDARIKAEQTLRTLQSDAKKIKIQVQKEGMELIKAGDIVSLDFPNHNIPKADYQVFEIENSLTSLLTLSVNTFNKSIAERLSELGVEQKVGLGKILTRNSEQEVIGKLFLDTVNINNISVKYQISRNENALGFNNTLGFNSQLGLDITDDTPHITERDE
jgi:prophage tail gpP-like protein